MNFHAFACTELTGSAFLSWGRLEVAGGARKEKWVAWV